MKEWEKYQIVNGTSMVMLFILLLLYIYAYCRARNGSRLADVKLISILLVVSSVAGIFRLGTQYA
jgi:hypothetical protein